MPWTPEAAVREWLITLATYSFLGGRPCAFATAVGYAARLVGMSRKDVEDIYRAARDISNVTPYRMGWIARMLRTDWSAGLADHYYPVRLLGQFDKSPEYQRGLNDAGLASEEILRLEKGNREGDTNFDCDEVINAWIDVAKELNIISDTDMEEELALMREEPALVPGPVYGFRAWRLKNGRLMSFHSNTIWDPKQPLTARCEHCGENCPGLNCDCGVYALRSPEESYGLIWRRSREESSDSSLPVLGLVALWGKVIVHTEGLRAQKAYPAALVFVANTPRLWNEADRLKDIYGVPVHAVSWIDDTDLELLRSYQKSYEMSLKLNQR